MFMLEGRTKYHAEFAQVAYKLALLGLTDKVIAETFVVSKVTLNKWKKQYPEFMNSVTRGKTFADGNVAMGLYQRATGYDFPSEKLFMTREGTVIRESIMVHVPADPGAALNWLKNRQPEIWRDKQQIEFAREMVVTMDLNGGDAGSNKIDELESDNSLEIDQ